MFRPLPFLLLGCLLLSPIAASAQDDAASADAKTVDAKVEAQTEASVFGVINVAGFDRLMGDIRAVLESANRGDLMAFVEGGLSAANGFKGLDRSRPMGAFVLLGNTQPPQPELIVYVPVSDIKELQNSVRLGPIALETEGDSTTDYKLVLPEQTFPGKLVNGYLYFGKNRESLAPSFPDPVAMTKTLTESFDMAGAIFPKNLPEGMPMMIMDYLRAEADNDLKKRPNESDEEHALRKKVSQDILGVVEQVLTEGERVAMGLEVTGEKISARFNIVPETGSSFASQMETFASNMTKATASRRALPEGRPVMASLSFDTPAYPPLQRLVVNRVEESIGDLVKNVGEDDAAKLNRLAALVKTNATEPAYHLDLHLVGEPPNVLSLLASMRLAKGDETGTAAADVLQRAVEAYGAEDITPNFKKDEASGIMLHRLTPDDISEEDRERFGDDPRIYFAFTKDHLFATFGSDDAMTLLSETLSATEKKDAAASMLDVRIHLSQFQGMIAEDNPDPNFQKAMTKAFAKGGDTISLTVVPSKEGLNAELKFEAGFVRMLGYLAAQASQGGR